MLTFTIKSDVDAASCPVGRGAYAAGPAFGGKGQSRPRLRGMGMLVFAGIAFLASALIAPEVRAALPFLDEALLVIGMVTVFLAVRAAFAARGHSGAGGARAMPRLPGLGDRGSEHSPDPHFEARFGAYAAAALEELSRPGDDDDDGIDTVAPDGSEGADSEQGGLRPTGGRDPGDSSVPSRRLSEALAVLPEPAPRSPAVTIAAMPAGLREHLWRPR